ncbi:metallophosphoesterase [Paraburkholderia unamae]|uniref:metallophosphoesterase n=1 Tax=Paraburkholderia unamae TaxID=219649 RepID=UPI003CCC6F52
MRYWRGASHLGPLQHLYCERGGGATFATAVTASNRLNPEPQLVLITGDLTDEGLPEEYEMLHELLAQLTHPNMVLPGNQR